MTGFDPETDRPVSPAQGKIVEVYERLKKQGDDEAATELRETQSVSIQLQIAKRQPEFDPKFDRASAVDKVTVANVYDALLDDGREEAAEELRSMELLNLQVEKATQLDQSRFDGEHLVRR